MHFSLRPFHYHNTPPTPSPLVGNSKPQFGNTLEEAQNSRNKSEGDIMDLKRKIGQLSNEVERLQGHLDRKLWL